MMTEALLVVFIVLIALPWCVYVSVKLGTYAFYRGKQLFDQENQNHGEKK